MSWSTPELRVRLVRRETSLSPPVKYFTDRCKALLLLWIFYVFVLSCVCYVFVHVCLYVLCGHLLGKGWPLGSRLWCLTVSLSLSHWYPGSGVVLDCSDSWCLHPYLLLISVWYYFQRASQRNSSAWVYIKPIIPRWLNNWMELCWRKQYFLKGLNLVYMRNS